MHFHCYILFHSHKCQRAHLWSRRNLSRTNADRNPERFTYFSICSQKRARRFKNAILCDLHFADVALMECSDFMQQLRSFKPQSLGCAVARRKSSTTLIFPLPPQACSGNLDCRFKSVYVLFNQKFQSEEQEDCIGTRLKKSNHNKIFRI